MLLFRHNPTIEMNNLMYFQPVLIFDSLTAEKRLIGLILFELHAAITETGKRKANPENLHSALMVNILY